MLPTILVVDADRQIRALLAHVLRQNGYLVLEAANQAQALQRARGSTIHLLLLDFNTGYVCEELSSIPVLYMTASSGPKLEKHQVLEKPFAMMSLIERVGHFVPGYRPTKRKTPVRLAKPTDVWLTPEASPLP